MIILSVIGFIQGGQIQYVWLFIDLNEVIGNSLLEIISNLGEYVFIVENMANSCIDIDMVWVEVDMVVLVISNVNIIFFDCGFLNG